MEIGKKKGIDFSKIGKALNRKLPLEFFYTFIKVFNPNAYEELSKRTMKNVFSYFFSILFLSYVLMILIALPVVINIESQIQTEFSKFDEFLVDLNVTMSEPIYIPQLGLRIDTINEKELTDENILITEKTFQSKPAICMIKPMCWFREDVNKIILDDYDNLVDKNDEVVSWLAWFVLFLLPWIIISMFFVLLVKYLLIALLITGAGFLFSKMINRKMKLKNIFKIALYSMTACVVLNTINLPLGLNLLYLPLVITLFYFVIGLILSSERGFKK